MSTIDVLPALSHRGRPGPPQAVRGPASPPGSAEIAGSIARLARALARADVAACLTVADDAVRVEACDPPAVDGAVRRGPAVCTGPAGRGTVIDRLVSGRSLGPPAGDRVVGSWSSSTATGAGRSASATSAPSPPSPARWPVSWPRRAWPCGRRTRPGHRGSAAPPRMATVRADRWGQRKSLRRERQSGPGASADP
jgi:hypothetical protein